MAGESITLTFEDELDVTRGDVIAHSENPPGVADVFEATVIWMGDDPMLRGRSYLMHIGGKTVPATIAPLKHKLNIDSMEPTAATKLELNEIGVADLELGQPIAFDPYGENRDTGGFILIDRITNNTVGAGLIHFALRRSQNLRWQVLSVDKHERAAPTPPAAYRAVADRAVRSGQVDAGQSDRGRAPPAWSSHLPAGRRQRPSRPERRSRVHPRRSGREHPAHRRRWPT